MTLVSRVFRDLCDGSKSPNRLPHRIAPTQTIEWIGRGTDMKTSNWMKRFAAIAGSAVIGVILAAGANAANPESVVAQVTFANPITITEVNSLQWGTLDVNLNLETIIIGTDSAVSGTGTALVIGATPAAANVTVGATAAGITILVDTIVSGAGYSLGTFMCDYNGGTVTACDGAGYAETAVASATLLIGATLTGDNTAGVGAANGSFEVTVTYQ